MIATRSNGLNESLPPTPDNNSGPKGVETGKPGPPLCHDQVAEAIKFLQDPSVRTAPRDQKHSFLKLKKGLSEAEIQAAFTATDNDGSSNDTSSDSILYWPEGDELPPPLPPAIQTTRTSWAQTLLGLIQASGIAYGSYLLFKDHLIPRLPLPPSQATLKASQDAIDHELERANTSLDNVASSTTQLVDTMKGQSESLESALNQIKEALEEMRQRDAEREQEWTSVTTELENLKRTVPLMLDKIRDSQAEVLLELQREVQSLKSLLAMRSSAGQIVQSMHSDALKPPGIPAWQLAMEETPGEDETTTTNSPQPGPTHMVIEDVPPLSLSSEKEAL